MATKNIFNILLSFIVIVIIARVYSDGNIIVCSNLILGSDFSDYVAF